VSTTGNTIGPNNVLSGNQGAGIVLTGVEAVNTVVVGNLIGTDAVGAAAIPNTSVGIGIGEGRATTQLDQAILCPAMEPKESCSTMP